MTGAMTYALFLTLERKIEKLTYGSLLETMREIVEQVNSGKCLNSRRLHKLFHRRIIQVGLITSYSSKFFLYFCDTKPIRRNEFNYLIYIITYLLKVSSNFHLIGETRPTREILN
jgi:hypothetical protein